MPNKLPVFATVGEAFRCAGRYWRPLLPNMLAIAALSFIGLPAMILPVVTHSFGLALVMGTALFVALFLAFLLLQTSAQRLACFGPTARVGFRFKIEERLFFLATLKLVLCLTLFLLIIGLPLLLFFNWLELRMEKSTAIILMLPFLVAGSAVLVWGTMRLVPILPAAAIGKRISLRQAFRVSRGNSLRIFVVFQLSSLPFVIGQSVIEPVIRSLFQRYPVASLAILAVALLLASAQTLVESLVPGLILRRLVTPLPPRPGDGTLPAH